ncbi:MAG: T9SS type A sorting domain-containing protein, partial [Flavobacteriales bacterium]
VCFTRIDFHAQAEWTRFSAPICPGETDAPEKLSLFFSSSWGDGGQGEAVVGSVFFVDDVEFIYPVDISVGDELTSKNWSVYPNPAVNVLNVKSLLGEQASIEILDITGKTVKAVNLTSDNTAIDVNKLVAGVYLYQIRSEENQVLRTGKLLVNP